MAGLVEVQRGCKGGKARRLFDIEADNQHEEPLLLAQIAAQQLLQMDLADGQGHAFRQRLSSWATAAAEVICSVTC